MEEGIFTNTFAQIVVERSIWGSLDFREEMSQFAFKRWSLTSLLGKRFFRRAFALASAVRGRHVLGEGMSGEGLSLEDKQVNILSA